LSSAPATAAMTSRSTLLDGAISRLSHRSSTLSSMFRASAPAAAIRSITRPRRWRTAILITTSSAAASSQKSHVFLTEQAKKLDQEQPRAGCAGLQSSISARTAPSGSSQKYLTPAAAITSCRTFPICHQRRRGAAQFQTSRISVAEGALMRAAKL